MGKNRHMSSNTNATWHIVTMAKIDICQVTQIQLDIFKIKNDERDKHQDQQIHGDVYKLEVLENFA